MKHGDLLRHLRRHGCYLMHKGGSHLLWSNLMIGALEVVPRHTEIANRLADKLCRALSVPEPGE